MEGKGKFRSTRGSLFRIATRARRKGGHPHLKRLFGGALDDRLGKAAHHQKKGLSRD